MQVLEDHLRLYSTNISSTHTCVHKSEIKVFAVQTMLLQKHAQLLRNITAINNSEQWNSLK